MSEDRTVTLTEEEWMIVRSGIYRMRADVLMVHRAVDSRARERWPKRRRADLRGLESITSELAQLDQKIQFAIADDMQKRRRKRK